MNVAANHHPKGHQNARGRIISMGNFQSSFNPDSYFIAWKDMIKEAIRRIDSDLQSALRRADDQSRETCLLRIHGKILDLFYKGIGSAMPFLSHSTCFCCLMQVPQHALRCGHGRCNA
jgi:hypothetical protein